MLKNFDHLTIVVRDLERAKAFFAVLGFKEAMSVVIAGEPFASYWVSRVSKRTTPHWCWSMSRRGPKSSFCATGIQIHCPIHISAIYTSLV